MRVLCLCFILLFAASSCGRKESAPGKPIVLVSIPTYLYFVERIAGDTVMRIPLVPPGANPHIYEGTPKEMQRFAEAALWLRLSDGSDKKTYAILKEQNPAMRIANIAAGIPLLSACESTHPLGEPHHRCHRHEDGMDMHIWLSPKLAKIQATTIAEQLTALLPQNEQLYAAALDVFLSDLEKVDKEIAQMLAPKKGTAILVSHPAFAYFCQDYSLAQLSIEMEGKEPLPQDVTRLLESAKKFHISNIIAEPQYSDKGAQLLANALEVPVYVVDPYAEDYLKNLRYLAQVVAK